MSRAYSRQETLSSSTRYPCRTAIDQCVEQTINCDAKVCGGIKFFASDSKQIIKWTLNRATQASNMYEIYEMADVKTTDDIHKHNRPHEIIKSERFISKLHDVITKEYLNPFHAGIELVSCIV